MRCIYKDCIETKITARCLCEKHYHKVKYLGKLDEYPRMKRKDGTGGFHLGYKKITINGKRIFEHRHIMEKHLGRKLDRSEKIHHKDGNRLNNSIKNLVIVSQSEHVKKFHNNMPRVYDWNKFNPVNSHGICPVCNRPSRGLCGLCQKHYDAWWHWKQRH